MKHLALVVLVACNSGAVAVSAGQTKLSTEEAKERLSKASPGQREYAKTHLKEFLADQIATPVLAAEATRLSIKPLRQVPGVAEDVMLAAAFKDKLAADIRSTLAAKDITDEEIMALYTNNPSYPYYPPRVMVVGNIFMKKEDAAEFARAAKTTKTTDAYRAAFQKMLMRKVQAETWDFDVTRSQNRWPESIVEPAFSAKIGDVVGPIEGKSSRYPEARHYVLRIEHIFPESNSFAQVKERLREMAMDARIVRDAEAEARKRVMSQAKFDDKALEILSKSL